MPRVAHVVLRDLSTAQYRCILTLTAVRGRGGGDRWMRSGSPR